MDNEQYKQIYVFRKPDHFKRNITILTTLILLVSITVVVEFFVYQNSKSLNPQIQAVNSKETSNQKVFSKILPFFYKNQPAVETVSKQTTVNKNNINNGEIAKKALTCLQNLKDENGLYLFSKNCQSNKTCDTLPCNHAGPRPIWASFKYYQSTNDQSQLEKINSDLIANTSKITVLQNDFWNCKLMYEMYGSHLFNETQKQLIQKICLTSVNNPEVTDIANEKISNFNPNEISAIYQQLATGNEKNINSPESFETVEMTEIAYLASEYNALYNFKNNPTDLKTAKYFFDQGLKRFLKKPDNDFAAFCTLGEASLDLYRTTNDQTYFNLAEYIYQTGKVPLSATPENNLTIKALCGHFAKNLYQTTKRPTYKDVKDRIVTSLISENLDSSNSPASVTNDGCFNQKDGAASSKFSTENSLIIDLLLDNK